MIDACLIKTCYFFFHSIDSLNKITIPSKCEKLAFKITRNQTRRVWKSNLKLLFAFSRLRNYVMKQRNVSSLHYKKNIVNYNNKIYEESFSLNSSCKIWNMLIYSENSLRLLNWTIKALLTHSIQNPLWENGCQPVGS